MARALARLIVDLLRGFTGAGILALFHPRGMTLFDTSRRGAAVSFLAAVVVLPIYLLLRLVQSPGLLGSGGWGVVGIEALTYVYGWTVFPALLTWVAPAIGHGERLFRAIATYNWAQGLLVVTVLPIAVLVREVPMLGDAGAFLLLILVVCYQWFVVRTGLGCSRIMAALLVAADNVFAASIERWAAGLVHGLSG